MKQIVANLSNQEYSSAISLFIVSVIQRGMATPFVRSFVLMNRPEGETLACSQLIPVILSQSFFQTLFNAVCSKDEQVVYNAFSILSRMLWKELPECTFVDFV